MSIINAAVMPMRTSTTRNPRNTFVLGSEALASKFYQEMIRREGFERVRLVQSVDLQNAANDGDVSRIVIADPQLEGNTELTNALIDYKFRGVKIETIVDTCEKTSRKIWLEGLSPQWLVLADGFSPSVSYLGIKRVFDVILSLVLLLLTAPLIALVAVAIRLDSPGSPIFRQERIGLNGRRFILYKFRSMRQDAERT